MTALYAMLISGILAAVLFLWKYGEWIAIPHAREAMVSLLKDPASVQVRNERITKAGVLCGEVNAKNGVGGYVGFRKYIAYGPQSNWVEKSGLLAEASTEEFIVRMEQKIALIKTHNRWRDEGIKVPEYSERELEEMVTDRIFREHWQESCESKSP